MDMVIDSRTSSDQTTGGSSELEDFLRTTLPRQMDAEEAIHNGDVEPRLAMWSREDPVTVFGAAGPNKSGWDEVSQTFRWVASTFSHCRDYRFELVAAGVSGDLAYTAGYERSTVSVNGGPPRSNILRVTHVYRRENGEWKIVHRHGDHPPIDQSPSAESSTEEATRGSAPTTSVSSVESAPVAEASRELILISEEATRSEASTHDVRDDTMLDPVARGFRLARGDDRLGERHNPGGILSFKVTSQDSHGALLAFELVHQAKGGPPRHLHHDQDEWFYVVEGEYLVTVGDEHFPMHAGDSAFGPREVPHTWAHVGDGTGRIVFTATPAGQLETFLRQLSRMGSMAPQDAAFFRAYDMELVGPPLAVE